MHRLAGGISHSAVKALTSLLAVLACEVVQGAAPQRAPREMGLVPPPKGNIMGWEKPGDIPSLPDTGELVVQKVRPVDCRVVRGFVHSPVDGRPDSWGYNGVVQEYDNSQGYASGHWQNVTYEFTKDPGVHVTLADDAGFNHLYIRGGFEGLIYRDVDALDGPGNGKLIAEIPVGTMGPGKDFDHILDFYRISFPEPVKAKRISFFKRNNMLSDVSFLRLGAFAIPANYTGALEYSVGASVTDLTVLGPDFVRLKAENPSEQHLSNFERRFFRESDRMVRLLKEKGEGESISLAAEQQMHFITPVLPANTPIGAVRFDLKLEGAPEGNIINLAVQDPLIGSQELIRIDVRMGKSGRMCCLMDFPDQLMAAGRRFWLTIASQNPVTLMPNSRISILTVKPEVAKEEYVAYRLFLLKGYFYVLSEARPWTGRVMSLKWLEDYDGKEWNIQRLRPQLVELFRTVENLKEVVPDHPIAVGQYYSWLTRAERPPFDPKDVPPMEPIPGVPRWAQLLDRAVKDVKYIPNWWITHRMMPNGEMGGFFSDDTDMFGWWLPLIFLDSREFGPKARRIFEVVAPQLLERNLKEGINIVVTDALHAYEEGQNHMAFMALVCYGDPRYVEWLMISAKSVEKWMYRTKDGKLKFRVNEFGYRTAMEPPPQPVESVSGAAALLLHSHLTLAWYNRNPHAIETIASFAHPDARNNLGGYGGPSIQFAAYWFTGDPIYLYLPPPEQKGRDKRGNWWGRFLPEFVVHGKEAHQQPWWKGYVEEVSKQWQLGDWAWATKPDKEILCKSLEYILYGNPHSRAGGASRYRYIWTEAEMFTDRIFIPVEAIAQPMLGGYTVRNRIFPTYAVSYEDLTDDFAALVLEQGRDRLKLAMINLRETPRSGAFRVWQLDHGKYELKIGPDGNDDGEMDSVEGTHIIQLKRMDMVPVNLPPRRVIIYTLRQIEKLDDLLARADLAICEADLVREGEKLKVTVHNIGSSPARDFVVALADAQGKILAQTTVSSLDAPLDMTPRHQVVTLPFLRGGTKVVLDPLDRVPEITETNNVVPLPRTP